MNEFGPQKTALTVIKLKAADTVKHIHFHTLIPADLKI